MTQSTPDLLDPDLVRTLLEFRRARNWDQFHTPKNLATAITVEAAELLEHFIWDIAPEPVGPGDRDRASIEAEVADVVILLTYLIHDLAIDVGAAVRSKVTANEAKYPVHKAYGSNRKYTDL